MSESAPPEEFCPITRRPHEYMLPVEWKYKFINDEGGTSQATVNHPWSYQKVTKLRCACGAECAR